LYTLPSIVRMINARILGWAGNVGKMKEGGCSFKSLADTPIGKRLLGWPKRRWEENITMDLKGICVNTRN
jgi:hypothetical protein